MKLIRILFGLALASLPSAMIAASESFSVDGNPYYEQADAYARATGLSSLATARGEEIRFWFRDYMLGNVQGIVFSKGLAVKCNAQSTYDAGVITIGRGHCSPVRGKVASAAILASIDRLSALNKAELHCAEVMDGRAFLIEGFHGNQRFALVGSNPSLCEGEASRTVTQVFSLLP